MEDMKGKSAMHRFMAKVRVDESGCWLWTGCMDGNQLDNKTGNPRGKYGRFALDGYHMIAAHRAAYILFVGPIPDGKVVCHKCDMPGCVFHEHLFLGTYQDNIDDMCAKGRGSHQRPGWVSPRKGTGVGRSVPGKGHSVIDTVCYICSSAMVQDRRAVKLGKRPCCSPACKGILNSRRMLGVLH